MKFINKFLIYFGISLFTIFICLVFVFNSRAEMSIGISPSTITVKDVANNVKFKRTVYLSGGGNTADKYYKVTVTGDGARHILLTDKTIRVPKDQKQYAYTFYIAPKNAANGNYKAQIVFMADKKSADYKSTSNSNSSGSSAGMSIQIGARAYVEFSVTDKEIKKVKVLTANFDDTEEKQAVILNFNTKNDGNVWDNVDEVAISLKDTTDYTNTFATTSTLSSKYLIEPGDKKYSSISFTINNLTVGKYLAKVDFIDNGKIIYTNDKLILNVYKEGTLKQSAKLEKFDINKKQFELAELVKLTGSIKNNGDIFIKPIFYVEISRDNKLLDIIRSQNVSKLGKNQTATMDLTFSPQKGGKYIAKGYFQYGVKKTLALEQKFEVVNKMMLYITWSVVGIIIIIAIIIAIYIVRKKRKVIKNKAN